MNLRSSAEPAAYQLKIFPRLLKTSMLSQLVSMAKQILEREGMDMVHRTLRHISRRIFCGRGLSYFRY